MIIYTGEANAVDAVKAKEAGADDYAIKTATSEYLVKSVKELS